MKNTLVTGAAGFVGFNLCRALLEKGHAVFAVDNFITGSRDNIAALSIHPNFSFFELDVCDHAFGEVFKPIPLEQIYHLACPTGVPNLKTLAEEMLRTCSVGALNALELARKKNARILAVSSAEMYGDPEKFPQEETYTGNVDPMGPRSAYEEGKRFKEACIAAYARKYGVHGTIVRIFNTYGPGMSLSDTRVIPTFTRLFLEKKPLFIYGNGSQSRSHLYIEDQLRGLLLVMEKGTPGEAYNVGSEREMSIKELAEMFVALSGHEAGIEYREHFISDHGGRRPSTEKVQKLGWKQNITLEEGLTRMLAHYQTERSPYHKKAVPVTA